MFSLDEVEQALPPQLKGGITTEIVDNLNKIVTDTEFAQTMRNNLVSYTSVLREGKFRLPDYFTAVAYVSYKLMGYSDRECYMKALPDRYQALVAKGCDSKTIAAYVVAYNKGKLVNLILEQALIPAHVLNADMFQKALNIQLELAMNAQSEKVRTDAANSLLTHRNPLNKRRFNLILVLIAPMT